MTRRTWRRAPVLDGTRAGKYKVAEASLAGETALSATNIAVAAARDAVAW